MITGLFNKYTIPRTIFAHILSGSVKQIPKDAIVLDIGCGQGDLISFVGEKLRRKTVGLDVDNQAVKIASTKAKGCSLNLGMVAYNGLLFPFRSETFDMAYAHEVVEHVNDDALFISEIHRILKNEGLLILTTPNAAITPFDDEMARFGHVRHYSKDELTRKLEEAGLSIANTYWRYHAFGALLDSALFNSRLYKTGARLLCSRQSECIPSFSPAQHRSKVLTWLVLQIYKYVIHPVITAIVLSEFEMKKVKVEAASMVIVCIKQQKN